MPQKRQAVLNAMLHPENASDPRYAGFKAELTSSMNGPLDEAMVERLYSTLPQ